GGAAGGAIGGVQQLIRLQGPDAHAAIGAGRYHPSAVGGIPHAPDLSGVAVECGERLAGGEVPRAQDHVVAAGDADPAVGRDVGGEHAVGVAVEAPQFLTGLDVPEANGAVPGSGEGLLAVGGAGDAV